MNVKLWYTFNIGYKINKKGIHYEFPNHIIMYFSINIDKFYLSTNQKY